MTRIGEYKFLVILLLLVQPGPVLSQTDEEIEDVFWQSVECKSKRQVQAYLEVYPTGRYLAEAWACQEGQLGLDRAERRLVQHGLAALDYSAGVADGLFGPATRRAIRTWQGAKEFAATGYLTRDQADTLMAQGREAVAEQRQREEARRQAQDSTQEIKRETEAAVRQEAEEKAALKTDIDVEEVILGSWSIDWQGANAHYTGTLSVDRQLATNKFHGWVELRWAGNNHVQQEAEITVSGEQVLINCFNPSMETWVPDNFFLTREGRRMDGYSIDDQGRKGSRITLTK